MPHVITYKECPACKSTSLAFVCEAKDYTVSGKTFAILQCSHCTLRFTQSAPGAEDIGAFYQSNNYISHTDTKKGLINQLYHSVRNITLKQKKKWVQKAAGVPEGTLLDVGAGTGAFANEMTRAGWKVTALEPDETARTQALNRYGLSLQLPEALFALPAQHFTAITLWHVLEHVHELHRYLDIFHTVLESNGVLLIAVPNYTSFDASYYKEYWAAYDVPRHLYHFSPQSMKSLLVAHGFTIVNIKPMPFDAFYVSMLSETYKRGNNHFAAAFATGLQSNIKAYGKPGRSSSVIYIARKS